MTASSAAILFFGLVVAIASAWVQGPPSLLSRKPSATCPRSRLFLAKSPQWDDDYLESLLYRYGFDSRLVTLSNADLPRLAEVHENGRPQVCQINGLELTATVPSIRVTKQDGTSRIVDLGMVTTIWENDEADLWSDEQLDQVQTQFPVGQVDMTLDLLYWSYVGRARSSSTGLHKKQVTALVEEAPLHLQETIGEVFRQVVKTGEGYARLVDSETVRQELFATKNSPTNVDPSLQRAISAISLGKDAEMGGRFKRRPCIVVSHTEDSITLVNGGWLVVDQSVRAGTEARKFAERDGTPQTAADERIARRLECLAMGQMIVDTSSDAKLEVDVRETLKAMGLAPTPEGAQEALLRIGRWSNELNRGRVNPWSQPILQAAKWYQEMDKQRRRDLFDAARSGTKMDLEGRVDLTKLPCVCVDAARASFRDDAISVRPRSSTGRKVIEEASKWEVLIHIADVSDIYSPNPVIDNSADRLELLRKAAASRGTSRYDLPLGPLHLMPPILLDALSLETINPDLSDKAPIPKGRPTTNRCVTLWVYIDERNGALLDAGMERSLISCPIALSFGTASGLMNGDLEASDPELAKTRAILGVADRNLRLWSNKHRIANEAARARENRLAVKEMVAQQISGDNQRDDGRDGGFQRSRGHRLVDASLQLYAVAIGGLLKRAMAPLPKVAGTGPLRGRLATAPLRRYVDGMAQRQALSVLCNFGGPPMTLEECIEVSKEATTAVNSVSNITPLKSGSTAIRVSSQQRQALQTLLSQGPAIYKAPVPAMGTGKKGEVVILGAGAVASCRGIRGTLKPGQRVMVRIQSVEKDRGTVSAVLVDE